MSIKGATAAGVSQLKICSSFDALLNHTLVSELQKYLIV